MDPLNLPMPHDLPNMNAARLLFPLRSHSDGRGEGQGEVRVRELHWMLDVGCSMFDVPHVHGEGWGLSGRSFGLPAVALAEVGANADEGAVLASRIHGQDRISALSFDVRRSTFDVRCFRVQGKGKGRGPSAHHRASFATRNPVFILFLAIACFFFTFPGAAQIAEPSPSTAILEDLYSFRSMGTVLYVAAHPDDENTQLIAYFARGRHYRTAYLSLTRGDGGQNVLGPQFGEELGIIRTEELAAARRVDGGRQFFSRAVDFGFSKDYRQTLKIWDREGVLSDMVRVIREFRPDVVITRFSPVPGGTHGHHTASTVLAIEAFKLAGDPAAFPDQLTTLKPWQAKRLLWNSGGFQRGGAATNTIRIDAGGKDAVSGETFADIAGLSRSMHKTQGFGKYTPSGSDGPHMESFTLLEGDPDTNDIMDGVDTTWSRVPGGADVGQLADKVIAQFDAQNPAASVPTLLQIKMLPANLAPNDPIVSEKRQQLDHIIQECLGLRVETTVPQAEVVPGVDLNLHMSASIHSGIVPVRWLAARFPSINAEFRVDAVLSTNSIIGRDVTGAYYPHDTYYWIKSTNSIISRDVMEWLPADTPVSQPYWLRVEHTAGMFQVSDPTLIGLRKTRRYFRCNRFSTWAARP